MWAWSEKSARRVLCTGMCRLISVRVCGPWSGSVTVFSEEVSWLTSLPGLAS